MSLLNPCPEKVQLNVDNNKKYEQYIFEALANDNYAKLIMMSEAELKEKTGKNYVYSNLYSYVGTKDDNYDTLWKQIKDGNGTNYDKKGIDVQILNNKSVIITFVYTAEKQKTVYVNYVEELQGGVLSELIAPKTENYSESDMGIHEYTLNNTNWFDLLSYIENTSPEKDKYEKYVFTELTKYPNLKARFIRMSDDELNYRMEIDDDNNKYKFEKLKYVDGKVGDTYESLLEKNAKSGKEAKAKSLSKTIKNQYPTLISFIYKTPAKDKLDIEVVHRNETTNKYLPIVDEGHILTNYIEKEVSGDNIHAYYKMDTQENDTTASVLIAQYEQDGKQCFYKQKIIVKYYKNNRQYASNEYKGVSEITINMKSALRSGYDKILITFIYGNNTTVTDAPFIVCPRLTFKSSINSNVNIDCENGTKGETLSTDCADYSPSPNTSYLTIPTDEQVIGNLNTNMYHLQNLEQLGVVSAYTHRIPFYGYKHEAVLAGMIADEVHGTPVYKTVEKTCSGSYTVTTRSGC